MDARTFTAGTLTVHQFPKADWILSSGGHGKTQFALQTQFLIDHLGSPAPRAVICAGSAGSLSPKAEPGHIVVATQTVEHDFRLKFADRPLPSFPGDQALLALMQSSCAKRKDVHFGPIASGDEDIIDEGDARHVYERPARSPSLGREPERARRRSIKFLIWNCGRSLTERMPIQPLILKFISRHLWPFCSM